MDAWSKSILFTYQRPYEILAEGLGWLMICFTKVGRSFNITITRFDGSDL